MLLTGLCAGVLLAVVYTLASVITPTTALPHLPEPLRNCNMAGYSERFSHSSDPKEALLQQVISDRHVKNKLYEEPIAQGLLLQEYLDTMQVLSEAYEHKKNQSLSPNMAQKVADAKNFLSCKGIVFSEKVLTPNALNKEKHRRKVRNLEDQATAHVVYLPSMSELGGLVENEPYDWLHSWVYPSNVVRKGDVKKQFLPCQIKHLILDDWEASEFFGIPRHVFFANINEATGKCYNSFNSMFRKQADGKCVPRKWADLHVSYIYKDEPKILLIHFRKVIALGAKCVYR